jgi:hypothetical protein
VPRALGWVAVLALVAWTAVARPRRDADRPIGVVRRLFGPVAGAAASVQWIRVDGAIRAGRPDLALARAETALTFDPGATGGWKLLAGHLAFDRASAERERDPQRRLAWVRAGLEVARRGERTARDPAELAWWQGLLLSMHADLDDLPWPGGAPALWRAAIEDFERAAELGHPEGEALADSARRRLAALR